MSKVAMCDVRSKEKRPRTQKKNTMVSCKKKWIEMNPIRRRMKKCNPSNEQHGQLVHWWGGVLRWAWYGGQKQSQPTATNAPIGRSVHWMGYVFSFGQMGFIIVPPHFFLLINYVFFFCGCFVAVFPLDLTSHLPCSLSYPHKYCTNLGTLFIIPY